MVKSWAQVQGIDNAHMQRLVQRDQTRGDFRFMGYLLIGLLLPPLVAATSSKEFDLCIFLLVAILVSSICLFASKLPKQEQAIINLIRKDFRDLKKIVPLSRKMLSDPHEESEKLKQYCSTRITLSVRAEDRIHTVENPAEVSILAAAAWLKFRDLAKKVEKEEEILAVLKQHGQPTDESSREQVRDKIQQGLDLGRKFALFADAHVGRFFDPKGPGNLWLS